MLSGVQLADVKGAAQALRRYGRHDYAKVIDAAANELAKSRERLAELEAKEQKREQFERESA